VRGLKPGDPIGGGREQDPVPCLGGLDAQPDGEVGLAGARFPPNLEGQSFLCFLFFVLEAV